MEGASQSEVFTICAIPDLTLLVALGGGYEIQALRDQVGFALIIGMATAILLCRWKKCICTDAMRITGRNFRLRTLHVFCPKDLQRESSASLVSPPWRQARTLECNEKKQEC